MPKSVATATSGESAIVDQDDHAVDRLADESRSRCRCVLAVAVHRGGDGEEHVFASTVYVSYDTMRCIDKGMGRGTKAVGQLGAEPNE